MERWITIASAAALFVLLVWLMVGSWRRRTARDSALSGYPVPTSVPDVTVEAEVLYVATTLAGKPLERLAITGLAFRAAAQLIVTEQGVLLRVTGASATWIPAERIVGISRASVAIDRAVEPDGLLGLEWRPQAAPRRAAGTSIFEHYTEAVVPKSEAAPPRVTSYLRTREGDNDLRIIQAVTALVGAGSGTDHEQGGQ
ncbi:MAG: hypothetical protein B5766_12235 [Candidatus Lumbricidophila eiseniae]|uniref:PH domain-containing protein n=1 Tax=Candidatus Lumbricidiphila eiseniae TaxID=1969409 RepID=A0A2A6FP91_9MICO|nr:MAG: hypothetical protein B5766_12235 [Candidatus Lumbricidophila eiseniae]